MLQGAHQHCKYLHQQPVMQATWKPFGMVRVLLRVACPQVGFYRLLLHCYNMSIDNYCHCGAADLAGQQNA